MAEKEKALSENGLLYFWKALKQIFAGKVDNVRYSGGKLYKDTTSYNAAGEPVGSATEVASASAIVTDGGGYKKPATGIPKTDLASGVQTSLDKADTALQSHQDISGKADKADFGFADGTAHTHANDKTQGTALKIYNPTLGSGQTADVVNSSTISGEATEDSADAKTHIPTWQGIMKWVKSLGYATVSATNTALAGKSKVTVNQPTSGTGTGTQLTVDGTTYQVVIDTDPGTDNGYDYKVAPTWYQMRTRLAGKVDNSVSGANSLFSNMPTGTAVPTDTTYLIRQATSGEASFWRVPFSTVWNYIVSKASDEVDEGDNAAIPSSQAIAEYIGYICMKTTSANTHDNMAGQRIIPISNPASGQVFAGCYGAVLQWTAYPNRQPSDGNPSWYFQLFGISDDKLYFRSRINGAAWSPVKRLAFANELPASTTYHLRLNTHVFQSGVTDTGNNFISIVALTRNSAGVETLYTTGTIVVKDATGTVRSTWVNKCYATFSGSGFNTFASYSGPFTVELQNASGTVLTSTQIVKV